MADLGGSGDLAPPHVHADPPATPSLLGEQPASRRSSVPPADPGRDLAGALHEVSNALTVVLGWIERARESASSPDELARALGIAASRAAEARGIVRTAIGAEAPAEQEEEVEALCTDALTGLDPELRAREIDARASVHPSLCERSVPRAASVRQILTNLLLNAAAMSPPGSTVRLEASPSSTGDGVVLSVTDAGPGIPAERRGALFHAGVSTRAGGAGIGLKYAAALARSQGGELVLAESSRGARFELSWPLVASGQAGHAGHGGHAGHAVRHHDGEAGAERAAAVVPRGGRALPLEGMRVLLVEDDDAVVDLLDTALTARGADVVSVRRRGELERALGGGHFDAALFDISPIQDDVRGAVSLAREACGGLRVVMISGSAAALPALPEGWISAWVRKPFEVGEIVQTIAPGERSR